MVGHVGSDHRPYVLPTPPLHDSFQLHGWWFNLVHSYATCMRTRATAAPPHGSPVEQPPIVRIVVASPLRDLYGGLSPTPCTWPMVR
jgi:hypothetical protein